MKHFSVLFILSECEPCNYVHKENQKQKYDHHLVVRSPVTVSDNIPIIISPPVMYGCLCACVEWIFILQRSKPLIFHIEGLSGWPLPSENLYIL